MGGNDLFSSYRLIAVRKIISAVETVRSEYIATISHPSVKAKLTSSKANTTQSNGIITPQFSQ
jgi:hypothetical protein